MPLFDLDRASLERYLPEIDEPADFDGFWATTLAEARTFELALTAAPVDTGLALVDTYDVTFAGFGGHPVRAWLTKPAGTTEPLPAVVEFVGYGGGRGLPHERLAWAAAGYAHLVMDTRGQGSAWGAGGDTPDPVGSAPAAPGFLTRGLLDPAEHYYRRVFTDAVRAVDAVRALDGVDASRVAVTSGSQGGGIALAVAGLVPDLVAVMPDVPFLCHYRRATEITANPPYAELTQYLSVHRDHVDTAFRTLSYLDGVSFARRANAPALFSVALMDLTCPPSTVYAAFNHYGTGTGAPPKDITVYPYNQHEGGAAWQLGRQIHWLADVHRTRTDGTDARPVLAAGTRG
ncbi:acetylxylan esterase [Georgenia subflava]|uniref:Prolyl oligopeptidase family serine peptidase n=1 Tax=Georgenia subflava TaxID=1622177 RepID=A0A6N7EH91_9MICO|nr:acetylxylan esterase [Georgenia subflava]MPV35516.1 prolyl oligopeptidase family serine peptidase [Georgenia subflava]